MRIEALEAAVAEHLTDDFLTGAIKAVFDARRTAHEICIDNFERQEAENLKPLIIRGKVNEQLRGVAARFPHCNADDERSAGSSMNRVEVRSGPVSLTAHAVQTACGNVKKYDYRKSLAAGNQLSLFDDPAEAGETLYVLLLHSAYQQAGLRVNSFDYLPGSIYLAFPTQGLDHYVHTINLVSRYEVLVDSLLPNEWDDRAKVAYRWQAVARDAG